MGKSVTPKYRVEVWENFRTSNLPCSAQMCWLSGKPTASNLKSWIEKYNDSFKVGGVNSHCSKAQGYIIYAHAAKIVNQFSGEIVASWNAPSFQVM